MIRSPLARRMFEVVLAEPIVLSRMSATSTAITWPTSWPARAAAVYSCGDPWNPATPIEVDYSWREYLRAVGRRHR